MRSQSLAALCIGLLALACEGRLHGYERGRAPEGSAGSSSGAGGGSAQPGTRETASARCSVSDVGPPQLRRLTQSEFGNTVADVFPEIAATWKGVRLGTDPVSSLGFTNDATVLLVGAQTAQEILETAEDVAKAVTSAEILPQVLACFQSAKDASCAAEFIAKYGPRLFRRALTTDENTRYNGVWSSVSSRSSFELGLKWALVAMLESPSMVYRSEIGAPGADGYSLSPSEIASELSYDFSGTLPSPELIARAEAGELATPEARVAEARSLLATARGQEVLTRMFREWIAYAKVSSATKNEVPDWENVRTSMMLETQRFIDDIVRVQSGGVLELLTSTKTWVDPTLAGFYGYGTSTGDFVQVDRPANWGKGLLAQGSILAGLAHSESSSPTQRGLVVYERLLCHARPPVPANVPQIEPPAPGAKTTRQRYQMHSTDAFCASCHQQWDPIGFGSEHFDQLGRYRADENGLPIDATGNVMNPDGSVAAAFDGLDELASGLADLPEVTDCVSGLLAAYVFAGGGGKSCLAEEARSALSQRQYGLAEYVVQLAAAPQFTRRKLQ